MVGKVEEKGDKANRMWKDLKVLQLIAFKGEMELGFEKNSKKQGVICPCLLFSLCLNRNVATIYCF